MQTFLSTSQFEVTNYNYSLFQILQNIDGSHCFPSRILNKVKLSYSTKGDGNKENVNLELRNNVKSFANIGKYTYFT